MRYLIPSLLLAVLLHGCDVITDPKEAMATPVNPGDTAAVHRVLLEDCTGFRCTNCPQAANMAQSLKALYGDRLVVVGVHMKDVFAAPEWPYDDGRYDTDFRTPAGNAYNATFPIIGLPSGLVDRKEYENVFALGIGSWGAAVAERMSMEPVLKLQFTAFTHDAGTNSVSATVEATALQPINGDHSITLYITEDHVIDWQLDNGVDISNYDHRHVLRAALNGPWGEPLITGSAQPGDTFTKNFTYPLPGNVLQPANCSLVAYVYSTGGSDQYEVKEVVERKFTP